MKRLPMKKSAGPRFFASHHSLLCGHRTDTARRYSGVRKASAYLALFGALAATGGAYASNADNVPDPDPVKQQADFIVPEGFAINLFASDPAVRNPIHMNWDQRGRLWVVCSPLYPHIKPGEVANDQVVVLEDVDGDGIAEKATVFAEGLHIPTAVLPYGDGCLVANSTELLWLHDRDGDTRVDPDGREVVFSGFGTEDTHHLLHTLRRGPDGMVYMVQSIYIHSHIETPFGIRRMLGGGVWMTNPRIGRMETYCLGFVNAWGLEFDRHGHAFATDGAGGNGINYIFPGSNHVASTQKGMPVLQGLNPGQPKYCGLEIVGSSHFPPDWQDTLITADFRGNRIARFRVEPSEAGFVSTRQPDVLSSRNRAFRPVDMRIGPDGALYICDFYNPIIQHGEVDFRDARRDQKHGRIWRLTVKDRPLLPRPNLVAMDNEALRRETRSPERWNSHFARVELEARGQSDAWKLDETEADTLALRRLMREASTPDEWTMELPASFSHASPMERLWWIIHSSRGFMESQATVRLNAVERLPRLLSILDMPTDRWIDFALSQYIRKTASEWLPALTSGRLRIENAGQLVYALQNSGDARALALLVAPLMQGTLAPETSAAVWRFAAQQGDAALLAEIFKAADPTPMGEQTLSALITAAEQRGVRAKGMEGQLSAWLDETRLPIPVRASAAHLAGLWKMEKERSRLETLAINDSEPTAVRSGALRGLAALGGDASASFLSGFAAEPARASLRIPAVISLLSIDVPAAARIAVSLLNEPVDTPEIEALLSATVQAKSGPDALVEALRDQTIPAELAASGMRIAGSAGLRDSRLVDAFRTAGKLAPILTMPDADTLAQLIARVSSEGDAKRGEAVYRRSELLCIFCHAIGETGGQIGPNLQSIGASAQVDYLIESLLDPTAKIKEGYHTTAITTRDGRTLAGMLVKDGDPVVLRDAAGVEHSLAAAQVERKDISPVSIMPPGLTASLAEPEFIDLVRFMADLGREGGVNLPPNTFVREWEALQPDGSWKKIIARVDGSLDLAEAPGRSIKTRLELPAPINVRFTSDAKATLTSNGNPVYGGTRALGAGSHDLVATWPDQPGYARLELIP